MHPSEHPTTEYLTAEHPTTAFGTDQPAGPHATAVLPGSTARRGRLSPDLVALIAGALFVLVAVLALVGTSLPGWVFGGGLVATVLVVLGAGLLVSELRRIKR